MILWQLSSSEDIARKATRLQLGADKGTLSLDSDKQIGQPGAGDQSSPNASLLSFCVHTLQSTSLEL